MTARAARPDKVLSFGLKHLVYLVIAFIFVLPLWWALAATIPIAIASWWVAYRSEWF